MLAVLATTNTTISNTMRSALSGTIGISPLIDRASAKYQAFVDLWQEQVTRRLTLLVVIATDVSSCVAAIVGIYGEQIRSHHRCW